MTMPISHATDTQVTGRMRSSAADTFDGKKPRLLAIEYIRGISMMGVIGIHVGSQYIENALSNPHLIALFEIVSRFSVPIFFFISAFGLFYNLDERKPFSYQNFLSRRFKAVLIPYVVWSLFYVIHDGCFYGTGFPDPSYFLSLLFFGNTKYHLYFLVILLWFYILMPLWIPIVRRLDLVSLTLLLLLQIGFDYWSSYSTALSLYIYGLPDTSHLKSFLMYRLNYWPLHYLFVFLLGGYLAMHARAFRTFLSEKRTTISIIFFITLAAMLTHYYKLLYLDGYSQLEAINTAHQLSPVGILYTVAASLFFFMLFTEVHFPVLLDRLLHTLGKHSYFAYLCHPFFISHLAGSGRIMTAAMAIIFYFITLILAVLAGVIFRRIGNVFPLLNELTIGVYSKRKH